MSRKLEDLDPIVREKVCQFLDACEVAGDRVIITYTLRTKQEQHALYAQGREALPLVNAKRAIAHMPPITEEANLRKVTWTTNSMHLYGVAADFVPIDAYNKPKWDDIEAFKRAGAIAKSLGFEWGGDWKKPDMPHIQFTAGLTLEQLEDGDRPSDVYNQASPTLSHGMPEEG